MSATRLTPALRALASGDDRALRSENAAWIWVDWRADPAEIVEDCARFLGDRAPTATWIEDAVELRLGKRVVRLEPPTPHATLRAVNTLVMPEHELRLLWASNGGDTLAFVSLTRSEWEELEREVGAERMERAFLRLAERPDVFQDRLRGLRPGKKTWWRFW